VSDVGSAASAQLPAFSIVVAADQANGIGRAGKLPWRLSAEMAHFKRLTTEAPGGRRNAVIMGRKTFESILPKFRPLSDRFNMVLSREPSYRPQGAFVVSSLDQALHELAKLETLGQVFCIGGGELYAAALQHPRCVRVHLTRVHAKFDCDTRLADLGADFRRVSEDGPKVEGEVSYTFEVYER
jgi:dihydrofolate reductase